MRRLIQLSVFISLCVAQLTASQSVQAASLKERVEQLKLVTISYGLTMLDVNGHKVMITKGMLVSETAGGGDGYSVLVNDNHAWQLVRMSGQKGNQTTFWSAPHTGEDSVSRVLFLVPTRDVSERPKDLYLLIVNRNYEASRLNKGPAVLSLYQLKFDNDFGIYEFTPIATQATQKNYKNVESALQNELNITVTDSSQ